MGFRIRHIWFMGAFLILLMLPTSLPLPISLILALPYVIIGLLFPNSKLNEWFDKKIY